MVSSAVSTSTAQSMAEVHAESRETAAAFPTKTGCNRHTALTVVGHSVVMVLSRVVRLSAWLDSALTVVGQCCNGVEQSGEATCVARLSTDSSGTQCCNGVEQSGEAICVARLSTDSSGTVL